MAQQSKQNKDLFSRLADRGEEFVGRITDLPGAKQFVDTTAALAKRVDEIQKRLRSLGPLEKRVTTIERRLDKLEGKGSTRKRSTTRKTTTASKRTTTPRRRPPSS